MTRDIIDYGSQSAAPARPSRKLVAVIGIDRYGEWPHLGNAVNDARAAFELFQRLGFTPARPPLVDEEATDDAIRRLVTDDLATSAPDDSLVIFFAGHGATRTHELNQHVSVKSGYLIPANGRRHLHHTSTWIRLQSWLEDIAHLPPRHILVILDACYSGIAIESLAKWRGEGHRPPGLGELADRRSRQIITSALDDQRALDGGPLPGHSLFMACLIEGLTGGLAASDRPLTTGRDLGLYLRRRVTEYPESIQTPDFATFAYDERGEILIPVLAAPAPGPGAPAPAGTGMPSPGGRIEPPRTPAPLAGATPPLARDAGPRSPFPDLPPSPAPPGVLEAAPRYAPGADELLRAVERALALRHMGGQIVRKRGPAGAPEPLQELLEIRLARGGYTRLYPVAVVEGAVDRPLLDAFLEQIVKRYRADTPYIEATLVHTGLPCTEVSVQARRSGVRLESLLELQGLLDFRPYVAEQTRWLERDSEYPSQHFVPQRITYRVGFETRAEDDALEALDAWLGHDGPQLAVVLGDSGSGKTFLMRELALRLGRRQDAIVPILVELRKLERSTSLEALLGQHFIPERGMERFDHAAFRYMLEEGRVALLFDGFDELALRATYDTAAEHLETVLQAAVGKAKVVITSRAQHFLSDRQVLQALGERARGRGFRLMHLQPFDGGRIRELLVNRFADPPVAHRRLALMREVEELTGLARNPRMLGLIAELEEQDLRGAVAAGGATAAAAAIYRVLLERWLGHEVQRDHPGGLEPGVSTEGRWKAVTELAGLLWTRKRHTLAIDELPPELLQEVERLAQRPLGRDAAAFKIGSATLLGRDEEGRFSFIHSSVMEWLVAHAAADELRAGRSPALLERAELSDLMADFLWSLAGRGRATAWAHHALAASPSEVLTANAIRLLRRLRRSATGEHAGGRGAITARACRPEPAPDVPLAPCSSVAFSPDGAFLAAAYRGGTIVVWDTATGTVLRALEGHADSAGSVAFSPDGRLLASGSFDRTVRLWRPDSGKLLRVLEGHADSVGSVAFSPDSRLLASSSFDGTVQLRGADRGKLLRVLRGHAGPVGSVAFSPDGRLLASGSRDRTVRLWSPDSGKLLHELGGHAAPVWSVAFSPDGGLLASGSADNTVRLWSPDTSERPCMLEGHADSIRSLAFSPDGALLASGSFDHTIRLWSPQTGQLVRTLEGHAAPVWSLAFSPDGALLASGSSDHTVRLWSPGHGKLVRALEGRCTLFGSVT